MESGKKRVNLMRPNQRPKFLEEKKDKLGHGLVIKEPFGIVYESDKREGFMFMRILKLGHCSTGTLLLIKNLLQEVIDNAREN